MTLENDHIRESREFYREYFAEDRELTYDNRQRYQIIYSLIDSLPVTSDANVLDVGSGSGRIVSFLDDRFTSVTALDIVVSPMLEKTAAELDVPLIEGALPDLPITDREYDLVVCSEVLEHIPGRDNQLKAVSELGRVTAEGGYVVISTPNPESPFYRARDVIRKIGSSLGLSEDAEEGGQHIENWIPASELRPVIESEFELLARRGSYYVLPDLGTGWKRYLHPFSDMITEKNIAPSYGLYQYYVTQI